MNKPLAQCGRSGIAAGTPRRQFLGALLICLIMGMLPTRSDASTGVVSRPVGVGDEVPAVIAFTLGREAFRLEDHRGKVVLLDFWASWCAPCMVSMPAYDVLYSNLKDQGFRMVGLNVDRDRQAALRAVEQVGVDFLIAFDPMNHWSQRFRLPGMPTAYLIDQQGIIRHVYTGFSHEHVPRLEAMIRALLADGADDADDADDAIDTLPSRSASP